MIFAGKEEEGVTRGAELAVLLDGVDLVDLGLDIGGGHGGIEDEDVGAEVALCGGCQGSGCECGDQGKGECKMNE